MTGQERLVLLLLTSTLAVGCGSSGDDDGRSIGGQEGRGDAEAAPPDGDVEARVEDLLGDYDRIVNEIMADPSVVADRDSQLVQDFLDLHEPDSEFAEGALEAWDESAEDGVSVQPYDDAHPALTTRLDGPAETVSDDEVTVPICEERRERVLENGQPTEGVPLLEEAAEVTVVDVDGEWLLGERVMRGDVVGCTTEGD